MKVETEEGGFEDLRDPSLSEGPDAIEGQEHPAHRGDGSYRNGASERVGREPQDPQRRCREDKVPQHLPGRAG